jgi:hypothetical protein
MRSSISAGRTQTARRGRAVRFLIRLGLLAAMIFCAYPAAYAAQPDPSRRVAARVQEGSEYLGVRRCKLCHDRRPELGQNDPTDKEFGFTDFVNLTEFHTWYDKDPHTRAFQALEDNLGKQIGRVLGIDAAKSESCLTCHATWRKDFRPSNQELRLGVTCESCHGPSRQWFIPHMDASWRAQSSQEKESFGMVDVRNPIKRAKQCFSCHVGSAAEEKIVTHAMYAAGHPVLPGLEAESFVRKVPAHWTPLAKKSDAIKQLVGYNPSEKSATKSTILAGVVALREAVNLFAARTSPESSGPDFADYNCYVCHHDLKKMSWRQRRGYYGTPGLPELREWPEALVKLAIYQTSKDAGSYQKKKQEFRGKLDRLYAAVSARPFGDSDRIGNSKDKSSASGDLIAWLDRMIAELEVSRYDQTTAIKILQKLAEPAERDDPPSAAYPDYDYARQIAWAMAVVYGDLERKPANDPVIMQVFKRLNEALSLETVPSASGKAEAPAAALKSAAAYDPAWFQEQLRALAKLFPKQ